MYTILAVAGRYRGAARKGVGDDIGNGKRRGLIVVSVIGRVSADGELRQRPRGQSKRIVRQMHVAAEGVRRGRGRSRQCAQRQESGILLEAAERGGIRQSRLERQLNVARGGGVRARV